LTFTFEVFACTHLHCVSKNDTNVAHYNCNAHQTILVILGRNADE